MSYSAYVLDENSRNKLIKEFGFSFEKQIGHHITYEFPNKKNIPNAQKFEVIGYVSDYSLEALIVRIDNNEFRPDGKKFHITWSLENDRKPVDSNYLIDETKVIGKRIYTDFSANPIPFVAYPKILK